jgi:hypothetical protein
LPITFLLRRYDERLLGEALAALAAARERCHAEPLYPWLETWRIDGVLSEQGPGADDFRALLERCSVGKAADLLDRSPLALAGCAADQDLRDAFAALESGARLEPWMREPALESARDGVLGSISKDDVARLAPRLAALDPACVLLEPEDLATYAGAWDRARRTFAVAADRGEAIALWFQAE